MCTVHAFEALCTVSEFSSLDQCPLRQNLQPFFNAEKTTRQCMLENLRASHESVSSVRGEITSEAVLQENKWYFTCPSVSDDQPRVPEAVVKVRVSDSRRTPLRT